MFPMQRGHHRFLVHPQKLTFGHCSRRSHAANLAGQRAFAEETPLANDADGRLFTGFGNDGESHFPFLNIEDRICRVALGENGFFPRNCHQGAALTDGGEESFGIEFEVLFLCCNWHPLESHFLEFRVLREAWAHSEAFPPACSHWTTITRVR